MSTCRYAESHFEGQDYHGDCGAAAEFLRRVLEEADALTNWAHANKAFW
jgi:hypothetical protein